MQTTSVLPMEQNHDAVSDDVAQVQAAQRDPAAFASLYYRYQERIYKYLRTRTVTEDDAADLTQRVFVDALHALAQYSPRRGPFAAWLFGIARNIVSDFHHRYRATLTWDLILEALQPFAAQDAEASMLQQEAVAQLGLIFNRLDADKRELLVLRFVAQLTTAQEALL